MAAEELHVSFERTDVSDTGIPINDLHKTLTRLQRAFTLMVSYLEEATTPKGRAPAWVRRSCTLRLLRTSPGSLVAEIGVPTIRDDRARLRDSSQMAIDRLLNWRQGENSSVADASVPDAVENELLRIGADLSPEVAFVRIADPVDGRYVVISRNETVGRLAASVAEFPQGSVRALLYGWLKAVNWDQGTAELHRYGERHVPLRFDTRLDDEMLLHARKFVEVTGEGTINRRDQWQYFRVEQLYSTAMGGEPFDLDSFLNDPNPKLFSSDTVIRTSEPFDVHDFIRVIREGRDVGRGE